jgi:Spy/CpxP family protein refolding chaperone
LFQFRYTGDNVTLNGENTSMERVMPSNIAVNSSSLSAFTLTRCFRFSAILMLSLLSIFPGMSAQSEDATITALKRGGSTYFTAKMQNLSDQLHLNASQETKLRPIAEQETAYIEQIRTNPVVSLNDKFKRLQEIVRGSDKQMKPFLSPEQWQKLQSLRKEQKATLEDYVNSR